MVYKSGDTVYKPCDRFTVTDCKSAAKDYKSVGMDSESESIVYKARVQIYTRLLHIGLLRTRQSNS